jgi:DNA-binding response OmpR family regulator
MSKTSKLPKRVLVVEDEPALNAAYRIILEKAGYGVATAFDGNEALKQAGEQDPDIILLDLKMPRMDGIAFLETYQPKLLKEKPKIIVFSNFDLQDEIDRAFMLGADKYVLKAWAAPKDLLKIVSEVEKL